MIRCTRCNSGEWKTLRRSAIDPAEDRFECKKCSHKFKRYDTPMATVRDTPRRSPNNHIRTCLCDLCSAENVFGANEREHPCVVCAAPVKPHPYDVYLRWEDTPGRSTSASGEAPTLSEAMNLGDRLVQENLAEVWGWDIRYLGEDVA